MISSLTKLFWLYLQANYLEGLIHYALKYKKKKTVEEFIENLGMVIYLILKHA